MQVSRTRCVDLLVGATGEVDLPLTVADIVHLLRRAHARRAGVGPAIRGGGLGGAVGRARRPAGPAARAGAGGPRQARVLMQAGDTAAAAELALASARAAEWVGAAIEAARSRLVAEQARAAGDDRDAALTTLRSAADELEATGALPLPCRGAA